MIETPPGLPTLTYERQLCDDGIHCIAGVDEVGRGALAGPLTAAAIILPPLSHIERDAAFWSAVRDSKTISMSRRVELAKEIMQRADAWAIAAVARDELDEVGVGAANRIAMERAVLALDREPEVLLIDAMTIDSGVPQLGIIDGDALSVSIAAASIIAKVARDTEMIGFHDTWPVFGFEKHKGYGVATHLAALAQHGPCPIHRRSFAPVRRAEEMHRGQTLGEA
jgi:ribonuclease HII